MMESRRRLGVLHVVDSLGRGGAERIVVDLVNCSNPDTVRPVVLTTRSPGVLADELTAGVPLVALRRSRRWDARGFVALRAAMSASGVDVVHAHGRHSMRAVAAVRLLSPSSAVHIFHDHSSSRQQLPWSTVGAVRLAIDGYVSPDESQRDWFVERWPASDFEAIVAPNGVDVARFEGISGLERATAEGPGSRLVGVVVANLREPKNHQLLLRALGASTVRDQIQLRLIGDSFGDRYEQECHEIVGGWGLEGSVTFLGARHDVPSLLAQADFGLLVSDAETGPVAVAEYLAAGLPVISTDVGGVVAGLPKELRRFVVPPGQTERVTRALEEVVHMATRDRQKLGAMGAAYARDNLTIEQGRDQIEDLYCRLVARSPVERLVRRWQRSLPPRSHSGSSSHGG